MSENRTAVSTQPTPPRRWYRLAHQNLCVTDIDFDQRFLIGFTQLIIKPMSPNLRGMHVNCRQCRIHRILLETADSDLDAVGRNLATSATGASKWSSSNPRTSHVPQPTDLPVVYNDPSLEICSRDCKLRTLDSFQRRHTAVVEASDPDKDTGELIIRIPPDFWPLVQHGIPLKITIEFSLSRPKSGFYFIVNPGEGSLADRGVHAFTAAIPNSSRLWFPCIDCSEPCTWKIEITVGEDLVAVASGELIDAPYYTEDLTHKTYHYYVSQPVAAPFIGLAVGAFEIYPDRVLTSSATHFCPHGLVSLLKHTVAHLPDIIEHYEALLTSQYPFSTIKTVFVDRAYSDFQAFASLLIFPVDLLHSSAIIDQAIETRKVLSLAVAWQFFGCFLTMQAWCDAWLPLGLAGYLSGLYQKRVFGTNEYRRIISNEMHYVTNYEHTRHGIVLDPSKSVGKITHFSLTNPYTISPNYLVAYFKKAHLVIRMLELRFGQPVLLQVLNKLLVLARLSAKSILLPGDASDETVTSNSKSDNKVTTDEALGDSAPITDARDSVNVQDTFGGGTVPPCLSDEHLANLILSTSSFRRIISMVTGQDIFNFLDQWVYHSGHVRLFAKFHFNRKRNVVELELKQDLQSRGTLNYTGPMSAMLQELDGAFMHTFKLEEGRTSRDLPCHSKSRKHRRKKIPLANGDEIDMDLGRIDVDSPLLWLRLDPDMGLVHSTFIDQPDYMWHLMLSHDRDCIGQLEAVRALRDFPSPETRHVLTSVIASERVFYRVRMEACFSLCYIANEMTTVTTGQSTGSNVATSCLIPIFWQFFSSPASRGLVRQNNFTDLQHYFLSRAMIRSLATLRVQQVCPREVLVFLTDLLHHNDNSQNPYSDCYYRAELIKAIKDTLTPAIVARGVMSASALPTEARTVVEEVSHYLNLDTHIPSYKNTVTVACIAAIRRLQRLGFLPVDPTMFYHYASPGFFYDLRLAAVEALVDYVRGEREQSALDWLFDELIECGDGTDASHARLRFETVQLLIRMPPFQRNEPSSRLDTPQLVERLWKLMNYGCASDARLRCAVADLYHILYGSRRPTCLPLPEGLMLLSVKEGRSVVNLAGEASNGVVDQLSDRKPIGHGEDGWIAANDDFAFEVIERAVEVDGESDRSLTAEDHHSPFKGRGSQLWTQASGFSVDHMSGKRTFSDQTELDTFHAVSDLPNSKRRTQRLSDDEDD